MIDRDDFYARFNDRSMRYSDRALDPNRRVAITADAHFASRPEGQAAIIVATNLLGRMTRRVRLAFADVAIDAALPWRGRSLHRQSLQDMRLVDPFGDFDTGQVEAGDYRIHLGPDGDRWIAHGADWGAYVGPAPSPLPAASTANIFGAVFAAVAAVSETFIGGCPDSIARPVLVDTLTWTSAVPAPGAATLPHDLGKIWLVGAGSVGSAALYFLTLAGCRFDTTAIDMDSVEIENLSRSPIFVFLDWDKPKVAAIERFLTTAGLPVVTEVAPLDQSRIWLERQAGEPDVLLSAANERNVRYIIESQFPPVQVYATTGRNWQATVLRHVPPIGCMLASKRLRDRLACSHGLRHGAGKIINARGEHGRDAPVPLVRRRRDGRGRDC